MSKILIIHPEDSSTKFLNKIKNNLLYKHNELTHHFNIKPKESSKIKCIETIQQYPKDSLIIFLGHGKSNSLYGSKGKYYDNKESISNDAINENPHLYYYDENFIDENNIEVFKNKNVFCLSCNSNGKIGNLAIESGAKTFLGFGDIPTSISEFKEKYDYVSNDLVRYMKSEINYIIKRSLNICIHKNLTFEELNNYIVFITNQRISEILINQKKNAERCKLTNNLYFFKSQIKIFGDKNNKLF